MSSAGNVIPQVVKKSLVFRLDRNKESLTNQYFNPEDYFIVTQSLNFSIFEFFNLSIFKFQIQGHIFHKQNTA